MSTLLPGANPQVVESAVTDMLEEELSRPRDPHHDQLERGAVQHDHLEFTLDRPSRSRAGRARQGVPGPGRLPEDIEEPVIAKQEADARPSSSWR